MIAVELQSRIDKAIKEVAQTYQKTQKRLGELKTQINELEIRITDNLYAKTSGDTDTLNSALNELIKLTDFMIAESESASEEYERLEHDMDISEPSGLKELKDLCKKTDQFATDLLCYSLAHFKRRDAQ